MALKYLMPWIVANQKTKPQSASKPPGRDAHVGASQRPSQSNPLVKSPGAKRLAILVACALGAAGEVQASERQTRLLRPPGWKAPKCTEDVTDRAVNPWPIFSDRR
jgi:hypothetical protein